ncbi:hypothetical protein H4219_003453 [Mycoemilia scoparia]|uniref:SAP domain-containing protein n=1 Tax=Mycoemilia scoparia TaxID=417184 RepID=A0A9W8DP74_9FUNG|nr:hypothetical protein H4219_003453 [Mycoemilia scoparia]
MVFLAALAARPVSKKPFQLLWKPLSQLSAFSNGQHTNSINWIRTRKNRPLSQLMLNRQKSTVPEPESLEDTQESKRQAEELYKIKKELEFSELELNPESIEDLRPNKPSPTTTTGEKKENNGTSVVGGVAREDILTQSQYERIALDIDNKFTSRQIKDYLKLIGLKCGGTKRVLIDRVMEVGWGLLILENIGKRRSVGQTSGVQREALDLEYSQFQVVLTKNRSYYEGLEKAMNVVITMDPTSQKIHIAGAQQNVEKAKAKILEMIESSKSVNINIPDSGLPTKVTSRTIDILKGSVSKYYKAKLNLENGRLVLTGKNPSLLQKAKRSIIPLLVESNDNVVVAATKNALYETPLQITPHSDPVRMSPFNSELWINRVTAQKASLANEVFSPLSFLTDHTVQTFNKPKDIHGGDLTSIREIIALYGKHIRKNQDAKSIISCSFGNALLPPLTTQPPLSSIEMHESPLEKALDIMYPKSESRNVWFFPNRTPVDWLQGHNASEIKKQALELTVAAKNTPHTNLSGSVVIKIPLIEGRFDMDHLEIEYLKSVHKTIVMLPEAATDMQFKLETKKSIALDADMRSKLGDYLSSFERDQIENQLKIPFDQEIYIDDKPFTISQGKLVNSTTRSLATGYSVNIAETWDLIDQCHYQDVEVQPVRTWGDSAQTKIFFNNQNELDRFIYYLITMTFKSTSSVSNSF